MAEEKQTEIKEKIVLQLGTVQWQTENDHPSGSGILHKAHHLAYQATGNFCYSIFPSFHQKNSDNRYTDDSVLIHELDHSLPFFNSTAYLSGGYWHKMTEEQVSTYLTELEDLVLQMWDKIEKKHGRGPDLVISHHCFVNAIILNKVILGKIKNKLIKNIPIFAVYIHGTSVKMFEKEIKGEDPKFPMRYFKMINDQLYLLDHYARPGFPNILYAISKDNIERLNKLFPKFPSSNIILSASGFDDRLFKPNKDFTISYALKDLTEACYPLAENEEKPELRKVPTDFKHLVLHVGKLVDWKRGPAIVRAAEVYENEIENVGTLFIGSGSAEQKKKFFHCIRNSKANNCYWIGPQLYQDLCKFYNAAAIGVYPSKNEPFGMVFVETLACGTPVLGANSGGPRDLVIKEVGHLCEETDDHEALSQELAKNIISAIKDDWKSKMSKACVKHAEPYSVSTQVVFLLQQSLAIKLNDA